MTTRSFVFDGRWYQTSMNLYHCVHMLRSIPQMVFKVRLQTPAE